MFTRRSCQRVAVAIALWCFGLAYTPSGSAVDLRDWGRKFPTAERFVVLSQFGNQAVLDKETQLVWQRAPTSNVAAWQVARGECGRLEIGGRRGWRLPSVHELSSLTRPDAPIGVLSLPAGHPFANVQLAPYWTADLFVIPGSLPTSAYVIVFNGPAIISTAGAAGSIHFWCVRASGEF